MCKATKDLQLNISVKTIGMSDQTSNGKQTIAKPKREGKQLRFWKPNINICLKIQAKSANNAEQLFQLLAVQTSHFPMGRIPL